VDFIVTFPTKRDEIFHHVVAELTSPLDVVCLKMLHSPAGLTPPAVSLHHLPAKIPIVFGGKN